METNDRTLNRLIAKREKAYKRHVVYGERCQELDAKIKDRRQELADAAARQEQQAAEEQAKQQAAETATA